MRSCGRSSEASPPSPANLLWPVAAVATDHARRPQQLFGMLPFVRLAEWPGIGHERTDLADETLRVWTLQSYLIIYRPTSRPLEIVRVVSGYRDLVSLFERPQR